MANELIHVGFTNAAQLHYVKEDKTEAYMYPDSDNECYIPLYMLAGHAHRAGFDSPLHCEHLRLHRENKELSAAEALAVEELEKVKTELLNVKKMAKAVIRECSRAGSYSEKVQALDDATD